MKTPATLDRDTTPQGRSAASRDARSGPAGTWSQTLDGSPRQLGQAAQLMALQRVGPEEEVPLQGRLLQRAAPEEELPVQGRLLQRAAPEEELPMQGRADPAVQDGLPAQLRAGIEALSGVDMSGVRVHSNSDRPAQVNALAFAQGQDIHLAPGQEHHLPHEAWHVAQQAQGRVQPTVQMAGAAINDDPALESEADVMGARALQQGQQIS
jgi:hypothetical protein